MNSITYEVRGQSLYVKPQPGFPDEGILHLRKNLSAFSTLGDRVQVGNKQIIIPLELAHVLEDEDSMKAFQTALWKAQKEFYDDFLRSEALKAEFAQKIQRISDKVANELSPTL